MTSTKAARAPTAQEHEFFSLNTRYHIAGDAKPDDLLEDTMSFLSCARGILQGFLSRDASSEELFGISFLLEMACGTLNATQEFSFVSVDERVARKAGAK